MCFVDVDISLKYFTVFDKLIHCKVIHPLQTPSFPKGFYQNVPTSQHANTWEGTSREHFTSRNDFLHCFIPEREAFLCDTYTLPGSTGLSGCQCRIEPCARTHVQLCPVSTGPGKKAGTRRALLGSGGDVDPQTLQPFPPTSALD